MGSWITFKPTRRNFAADSHTTDDATMPLTMLSEYSGHVIANTVPAPANQVGHNTSPRAFSCMMMAAPIRHQALFSNQHPTWLDRKKKDELLCQVACQGDRLERTDLPRVAPHSCRDAAPFELYNDLEIFVCLVSYLSGIVFG